MLYHKRQQFYLRLNNQKTNMENPGLLKKGMRVGKWRNWTRTFYQTRFRMLRKWMRLIRWVLMKMHSSVNIKLLLLLWLIGRLILSWKNLILEVCFFIYLYNFNSYILANFNLIFVKNSEIFWPLFF
jgi:hypothetical protein